MIISLGRNKQIGAYLESLGALFINTDISQPITIPDVFGSCQAIIHCAALSAPWGNYNDFYTSNVMGTQNVINVAIKHNCPLIHLSTSSVYFNFNDQLDILETAQLPKKFASFYTATKKQAEDLIINAHCAGLKTVILRPRGIFGPHDTGLVSRLMRIASKGYFPLIRNGEIVIDITYVDNLVQAIILCLKNIDTVNGEIINISNNNPLKLKHILTMLFSALQLNVRFIPVPVVLLKTIALIGQQTSMLCNYQFEPPITSYSLGLITYAQTLNITKAQKLLGYQPTISIEDGIKNYVKWLNHG